MSESRPAPPVHNTRMGHVPGTVQMHTSFSLAFRKFHRAGIALFLPVSTLARRATTSRSCTAPLQMGRRTPVGQPFPKGCICGERPDTRNKDKHTVNARVRFRQVMSFGCVHAPRTARADKAWSTILGNPVWLLPEGQVLQCREREPRANLRRNGHVRKCSLERKNSACGVVASELCRILKDSHAECVCHTCGGEWTTGARLIQRQRSFLAR